MTQDEFTQAVQTGSVSAEQPQASDAHPAAAQPSPAATPAPLPDVSQYIPQLVALQSTQRYLTVAPTFIPQTFQDQIQFVYDGANYWIYFYANNQWNKTLAGGNYQAQSLTAHTAVTKGQAVTVGSGKSGYLTANQTLFEVSDPFNGTTLNFIGQTFTTDARTTSIRAITMRLTQNVAASITWTLNLYATSGGVPTGASLGSDNFTDNANGTTIHTFFSGGGGVTVSGNTQYAAVLSVTAPGNCTATEHAAGLSGGTLLHSADGIAWSTDGTKTIYIQVFETITAAGQVQPTDTTQTPFSGDTNDLATNFIGFALQSVSAGITCPVNLGPVDIDQSSLSPGTEYFLNGASGQISATVAPLITVKVGLALSATKLLVKLDNYP